MTGDAMATRRCGSSHQQENKNRTLLLGQPSRQGQRASHILDLADYLRLSQRIQQRPYPRSRRQIQRSHQGMSINQRHRRDQALIFLEICCQQQTLPLEQGQPSILVELTWLDGQIQRQFQQRALDARSPRARQ